MKVAFLGPKTSFSYEAAVKAFPKAELIETHSIQSVFNLVSLNKADFGVVPIENSTEGSVNITSDLLISSNLLISGEIFIDVVHSFLSKSRPEEIEIIYSYPLAFAQCTAWLQKNYPHAKLISEASTAFAAERVSKELKTAAIASKNTAQKFGLDVLADKIQDLSFNKTRFIVIGKKPAKPAKGNKTTMVFAVKNRPGVLFDCLKLFKDSNINLTKLESRPSKKQAWEYVFFIEFEGDLSEEHVKKTLLELKEYTINVKFFGSYPKVGD